MNIYRLVAADHASFLKVDDLLSDANFVLFLRGALGAPIGIEEWHPPRMRRVSDEEYPGAGESSRTDVCSYSVYLVLTAKALGQFAPLLEGIAEFWPVSVGDELMSMMNLTNVVDVLDEERSALWLNSDGSIYQVNRPVFRADVAFAGDAFVVPQTPRQMYFTEQFCDQLHLTGLRKVLVGEVPGW